MSCNNLFPVFLEKQQKIHQKQIAELTDKIDKMCATIKAHEKRLDEGKKRRLLLEEKLSFRVKNGKRNNVDASTGKNACLQCPHKVFLSQRDLLRHTVDKHSAALSQDTIFGAASPNLAPPPSSPPAAADLPV